MGTARGTDEDVADTLVARALDGARRPALVLRADAADAAGTPRPTDDGVTTVPPGDLPAAPDGASWRTVVLVADDPADLRRLAPVVTVSGTGWAREVAVVVRRADTPLTWADPSPGPTAPAVRRPERVESVLAHGGTLLTATLDRRGDVGAVLTAVALAAGTTRATTGDPDVGVHNPVGFRRRWTRDHVDLDPRAPLTPALVAGLRDARGVRVPPDADPRTVQGLAMAGVPLVRPGDDDVPDDALAREERSVAQRRTALVAHAHDSGWRAPTVSVLLATRRPAMLGHALAQVARQRLALPGAAIEVVVAPHGWDADETEITAALPRTPYVVRPVAADAPLGAVLQEATDAASGDVLLKLDDDDWYGPDVVTDLLLARRYSGATLVGMPAELVRVVPADATVRRKGPSENFGPLVAGGTMLIGAADLRALGGWRPVPRHVDARLLDDLLAAGGTVYRTHGLGYLLRREADGHTWDPGTDYFLRPDSLLDRWAGFRPPPSVGIVEQAGSTP